MAKPKFHKLEVRPKNPKKPLIGMNAQLYIDGKLAKGVTSFSFDIDAAGTSVAKIEMIAGEFIVGGVVPKIRAR